MVIELLGLAGGLHRRGSGHADDGVLADVVVLLNLKQGVLIAVAPIVGCSKDVVGAHRGRRALGLAVAVEDAIEQEQAGPEIAAHSR